jgi:hypothetical protein
VTGPYDTRNQARSDPRVMAVYDRFADAPAGGMAAAKLAILMGACEESRVVLGDFDRRSLAVIAGDSPEVCASVAGIIERSSDLRALLAGARTEELRAALEADPKVRIQLRAILRDMDGES